MTGIHLYKEGKNTRPLVNFTDHPLSCKTMTSAVNNSECEELQDDFAGRHLYFIDEEGKKLRFKPLTSGHRRRRLSIA